MGHSIYPGAVKDQVGIPSFATKIHQQTNLPSQHVYNQHQFNQAGYRQHMVGGSQVLTNLHQMSRTQQQQTPQQSHLSIPGQTPQTHPQQIHISQKQLVQQQQLQQQPTHGSPPAQLHWPNRHEPTTQQLHESPVPCTLPATITSNVAVVTPDFSAHTNVPPTNHAPKQPTGQCRRIEAPQSTL